MECVKRLVLPHAANIRDMGGFVTKNGKAVRWNRLFRADALTSEAARKSGCSPTTCRRA